MFDKTIQILLIVFMSGLITSVITLLGAGCYAVIKEMLKL